MAKSGAPGLTSIGDPLFSIYPQKVVKKAKNGANLSVKQYVLTSIGKDEWKISLKNG